MTAEEWFQANLTDPVCSDVAEHLVLLKRYASVCDSIVEAGVYDGTTALAFLLGRPKSLRCVDIARRPEVDRLEDAARELGVDFTFTLGDAAEVKPSSCDLLYIDTWHYAEQLAKEFANWHAFTRRYMILHDTESHGDSGMCNGGGLWEAIGGFLKEHSEWRLAWHRENALGLSCIMRISG
jgi:hypothetical protein